jgi:hypothetical protein
VTPAPTEGTAARRSPPPLPRGGDQVGELTPQPLTVFGWVVAAIHETIAGLGGHGVEFVRYEGMGQDSACVWSAPGGAQVAWFRDPDGNVLSLTQLPG